MATRFGSQQLAQSHKFCLRHRYRKAIGAIGVAIGVEGVAIDEWAILQGKGHKGRGL